LQRVVLLRLAGPLRIRTRCCAGVGGGLLFWETLVAICHDFTVRRASEKALRRCWAFAMDCYSALPARRRRTRAPPRSDSSAHTAPPWRSATCLTMASPSPEPGMDRELVER